MKHLTMVDFCLVVAAGLMVNGGIGLSRSVFEGSWTHTNILNPGEYQTLTSHNEYFVVQRTDEKTASEPLFIKKKADEIIPPRFVVDKKNKLIEISVGAGPR